MTARPMSMSGLGGSGGVGVFGTGSRGGANARSARRLEAALRCVVMAWRRWMLLAIVAWGVAAGALAIGLHNRAQQSLLVWNLMCPGAYPCQQPREVGSMVGPGYVGWFVGAGVLLLVGVTSTVVVWRRRRSRGRAGSLAASS